MKAAFRRPPLTFPVRLTAPAGPSPTRVHVAGVADGHGAEVVGFWQIGSDLELTWYARGTRLGLRSPSLRFPGLFALWHRGGPRGAHPADPGRHGHYG